MPASRASRRLTGGVLASMKPVTSTSSICIEKVSSSQKPSPHMRDHRHRRLALDRRSRRRRRPASGSGRRCRGRAGTGRPAGPAAWRGSEHGVPSRTMSVKGVSAARGRNKRRPRQSAAGPKIGGKSAGFCCLRESPIYSMKQRIWPNIFPFSHRDRRVVAWAWRGLALPPGRLRGIRLGRARPLRHRDHHQPGATRLRPGEDPARLPRRPGRDLAPRLPRRTRPLRRRCLDRDVRGGGRALLARLL